MSTATATQPQSAVATSEASRGGQRRRRPRAHNPNTEQNQQEGWQAQAQPSSRGGRSGRGRGRGHGALIPTPVRASTPVASTQDPGNTNAAPSSSSSRGGQRGRGRGNRGGPAQRFQQRVAAGGRQFGGQLTADDENTSEASVQAASGLQADAPAFQPGQPVAPRKQRPPREKKPQLPKSNAPDIATRTHQDIDNGHYECAICTEEVKRHSRGIWSCRTCWTVFHLGCIKKWSTNEGSAAARQQAQDGELPPPRQWRCPGCNLPKDGLPKNCYCWCEKELDPKSVTGLPPFSCGQTCSRPRILPKKCPHVCSETCHAGPCPPCGLMGPTQECFCGKRQVTRRCLDTDYEHGWSCRGVCNGLMSCGEHRCERACHDGPCGPCEVRMPARCYCGQVEKDILCHDRTSPKESRQTHVAIDGTATVESWTGTFDCPNVCSRSFDCGKHTCKKTCHQQVAEIPHCPRSPDLVTHCPCGKTPLIQIENASRKTCEDPIANCKKACHKALPCGHHCEQLCHQGDCLPCLKRVPISCRCGRTTSKTICHQGIEEAPQCMRVCRVSLNCGRHECGERCCAGEKKAAERQSSRRRPRPLDAATTRRPAENFEAEHICTRSCGRQLKCGNPVHRCQELCHKGACGSCREAIFDELNCNCGRTVLQPPLPCGTQPPLCRFPCERPKDCGHPQMPHSCHGDEENCPKCPFLTTKTCLCGKNVLKNQPCWLADVRCGDICGKILRCGVHRCQKQCHRPGECEEPCKQLCGKDLSVCGHSCTVSCHFPTLCREDKPCQHKILVTCECQRIKQEAKCAASTQSEGNLKKALKCDDECARLERNHKLALALNVDPDHQSDHIPYSTETLNMYQQNSTWAAMQEKLLRVFAADPEAKRFRLKPMQRHQRAFVHSLAEDFGFDSESMDPEPHRHVALFKTPKFVMAPMKTLAECARTRPVVQRPAPAPTAASVLKPKPSNTTGDPYNAFLLTNPRFALTIEEVQTIVKTVLASTSFSLEFEVSFLPSDAVSLKPPLMARVNTDEREMQQRLESIKDPLSQAFNAQKIGKIQLARLDMSLNVLRKESDIGPGSGWSQVAASRGAPTRLVPRGTTFGNKGGFAVLSLSSKKKKEKAKEAEIVEDWEAAEEQEEEKERKSEVNSATVSEGEEAGPSRPRSVVVGENPKEGQKDAKQITKEEFLMSPSAARWADLDDE